MPIFWSKRGRNNCLMKDFITCSLRHIYTVRIIESSRVTCLLLVAYLGCMIIRYNILGGKSERKRPFGVIAIICLILKCVLNECRMRMWTGLKWFSSSLLRTRKRIILHRKKRRIFWLVKCLQGFQESLFCVALVACSYFWGSCERAVLMKPGEGSRWGIVGQLFHLHSENIF
jgi:hypothetical protein